MLIAAILGTVGIPLSVAMGQYAGTGHRNEDDPPPGFSRFSQPSSGRH